MLKLLLCNRIRQILHGLGWEGRRAARPAGRRRTAPPLAVEGLEDRCLLSPLHAISLPGAGDSFAAAASADGRYTVFTSSAPNLVANQVNQNSSQNVFVYDHLLGTVALVNHLPSLSTTTGNQGLGAAGDSGPPRYLVPVVSADGRYIAFASYDTNLVPGESLPGGSPGSVLCLYRYDTQTGDVGLVNHVAGEPSVIDAAHQAASPAINDDGSRIVYVSGLTPSVSGNVALYDAVADATRYTPSVTRSQPFISGDGKEIVARVGNDFDIYQGDKGFRHGAIGGDGSILLAAGDPAGDDFITSVRHLVYQSATSLTTPPDGPITDAVLSHDGKYIVFVSAATDLVRPLFHPLMPGAGSVGGPADLLRRSVSNVYLKDVATGAVTLVSRSAAGPGNGDSDSPVISDDDSSVVYRSDATNLVDGSVTGSNIYEFTVQTGAQTLISHVAGDPTTAAGGASEPAVDGDGHLVAYASTAGDLVPSQSGPAAVENVFLWTRQLNTTVLASGTYGSPTHTGNADSDHPLLSRDGFPVFTSKATDLDRVAGGAEGGGHAVYINVVVEVNLAPGTIPDGMPAGSRVGILSVATALAGQYLAPRYWLVDGEADDASFHLGGTAGGGVPLLIEVQVRYAAKPSFLVSLHVDIGFGDDWILLPIDVVAGDGTGGGAGSSGNHGGGQGNAALGGIVAQLTPTRVGRRKKKMMMIEVFDQATGALRKRLVVPFQGPGFRSFAVNLRDPDGDGIPDEVVVTAKKGRRTVRAVLPL
jgi:Tol biopolymer transport system component